MNVSEAVVRRKSIRKFLDKTVANETIAKLLEKSARSPSGGNVQPWHVYVINGDSMTRFLAHIEASPDNETPPYEVYPPKLKEPYRSYRYKLGEDMYALLGIPREDRAARLAHVARNYCFFDAPAAFFCYVDKIMGPPQWSDLGMFLQTFMLLAQEEGLDTCPQEAWANRAQAVTQFFQPPEELTLFCGMAIGYADPEAPVNRLESERAPLADWARFID